MSFIPTEPGYILPDTLEDIDMETMLVDSAELDTDQIDIAALIEDAVHENRLDDIIDLIDNAPATDAASPVEREGFTQAPITKQKPFALHYAARDGDVDKIKKLINDGYDVNYEDKRSARPLHYAALAGKKAAVSYLIENKSDVHDIAYEGNTALHFALKKHHYDIAKELIFKGKANPYVINGAGYNPLYYLVKDLSKKALLHKEGESLDSIKKLLDTVLDFATQGDATYIVSEGSFKKDNVNYAKESPLVIELLLLASHATSKELQKILLDGAHNIGAHDSNHQSYLQALNLLHRFPTGGIYDLSLTKGNSMVLVSEGHYGLFTTALARDSLAAFLETIPDSADLSLLKEIFKSVYETYANAADYCENKLQDTTYAQALALYNAGKTVLLPSGWSGHFVDVIVSKTQKMYVVANSGDRYVGEPSLQEDSENEPGDNAGLIFYKFEDGDKLDEKFFKSILTNDARVKLELELPMKYGMVESLFSIENPDQKYGNCGWESHRDAIEGNLLIELLNRNVPFEQAKDQAKHMYETWDLFHGNYIIDSYMENHPGLPVEALLDILSCLQPPKSEENKPSPQVATEDAGKIEYNEIKMELHGKKIVETLQSAHYKEDFKDFIKSLDLDDAACKTFLQTLKENYQVDVDAIIAQPQEAQAPVTTEVGVPDNLSVLPSEAPHTSPHFNIAHQIMVERCLTGEPIII